MGANYTRGLSCDSGNYKRRFERAKRERDKKRAKVHAALRAAGFRCENGIWVGNNGENVVQTEVSE